MINNILDSLAGLIPGGEALKEYKEAIEQSIDGEDNESVENADTV